MSDFRVQNFEVVISPGDSQTDIEIPKVIDLSKTRVILASPGSQMIVKNVSGSIASRDHQIAIEIVDSKTVRVNSSPNKSYSGIASFSLMEYVGPTGGPNEFSVKRTLVRIPAGSNGVDMAALGEGVNAGAEARSTVHITGVILDNIVDSDAPGDFRDGMLAFPLYRREPDVNTLTVQEIALGLSLVSIIVYVETIDWFGSNWTIGYAPFGQGTPGASDTITFTVSGSPFKSVAITPVSSWENTWIEQYRGINAFVASVYGETISHIRPELAATVSVWAVTPTGADTSNVSVNGAAFYTISNPDVKVSHQGFFLGNGNADIEEVDANGQVTIQAPVSTLTTIIDAKNDRAFCVFTGTATFGFATDEASCQLNGDGESMTFRKWLPIAGWAEYIQTVQLGLDRSPSGKLEESIVHQPSWLTSIKKK